MDLTGDTPILISPFGYNDQALSVTITEENGTTGFIHRGKVYTTRAEVPHSPDGGNESTGTILEYSIIDKSHCQFRMVS